MQYHSFVLTFGWSEDEANTSRGNAVSLEWKNGFYSYRLDMGMRRIAITRKLHKIRRRQKGLGINCSHLGSNRVMLILNQPSGRLYRARTDETSDREMLQIASVDELLHIQEKVVFREGEPHAEMVQKTSEIC